MYKPGVKYIVLDIFSRLQAAKSQKPIIITKLDFDYISAYNFITSLYNISPEFRKKLETSYKLDPIWSKVRVQLKKNNTLGTNKTILKFEVYNSLI
jgi:hypothetical protein